MSCECFKIGGPWITFDPNCEAHGYEAQRREREREEREIEAEAEKNVLTERVRSLEKDIEIMKDASVQLDEALAILRAEAKKWQYKG